MRKLIILTAEVAKHEIFTTLNPTTIPLHLMSERKLSNKVWTFHPDELKKYTILRIWFSAKKLKFSELPELQLEMYVNGEPELNFMCSQYALNSHTKPNVLEIDISKLKYNIILLVIDGLTDEQSDKLYAWNF